MRHPVRSAPALRAAFSSYPHALVLAKPSPVLIRIAPTAGGAALDAASNTAGRRSTRVIVAFNVAIAIAVAALLVAAEWCARVAFDGYHHNHRHAAESAPRGR